MWWKVGRSRWWLPLIVLGSPRAIGTVGRSP